MTEDRARQLLRGAVDIHMHTAPDIYPRGVTDLDAAIQAKAAGMRAIMIKCHVTSTGDRAEIASAVTGLQVFGGIVLNHPVGGINVEAVRTAILLGAKQVWMPTTQSAQYLKHVGSIPMFAASMPRGITGLSVLQDGHLIPEIAPILRLVAENDVILGTGHLHKAEAFALVDAARAAGVANVLITHPLADFLEYTIDELKVLAAKGAILEHHWAFCTPAVQNQLDPAWVAGAIKAIGPESCIMATDGGQEINPPPVEMMVRFIAEMLKNGLAEEEVSVMVRDNPARILGL
ncbi:MAG: DUF6282 family protein [Chloroflexi bacterium]|nr:DUF6282 family protein [Chloroflexota bacterium]